MGEELEIIENQINPITPKKHINKEQHLFIHHEIPEHLQVKFTNKEEELLEQISAKLQKLDLTNI
jgi:hypothetical protein